MEIRRWLDWHLRPGTKLNHMYTVERLAEWCSRDIGVAVSAQDMEDTLTDAGYQAEYYRSMYKSLCGWRYHIAKNVHATDTRQHPWLERRFLEEIEGCDVELIRVKPGEWLVLLPGGQTVSVWTREDEGFRMQERERRGYTVWRIDSLDALESFFREVVMPSEICAP